MTDHPELRAPWTSEQVDALNRFQTESGMHPFTCPNGQTLKASKSGWYCPDVGEDTGCDYTQNWAHLFMAQPDSWPRTAWARDGRHGPTPEEAKAACSGEEGFCLEHGYHRHSLKQPARAIADAFEVPLHLIGSTQPVERCGAVFPAFEGTLPTECVLRPGHQGSHANEYDTRWIETPAARYCPHCGRGDAGPTADQYKQLRTVHRHEEELSADLRRRLQATSDACSDATTLLYRIGELHTTELSNEYGATECRTCRDPWPCDTANLLATLDQPTETAP